MSSFTQTIQPVERPGRLHLAILEWQRQLIAMKRPVAPLVNCRVPQAGAVPA
jgi:hypothetical protein